MVAPSYLVAVRGPGVGTGDERREGRRAGCLWIRRRGRCPLAWCLCVGTLLEVEGIMGEIMLIYLRCIVFRIAIN